MINYRSYKNPPLRRKMSQLNLVQTRIGAEWFSKIRVNR
jgi:hypothetical protein